MPNKEGGYGGYQPKEKRSRQVKAPGSGGVRRVTPGSQPVQQVRQPGTRPSAEPRNVYRAPYAPPSADAADGWQSPLQPPRTAQQPAADPSRQAMRAAARRARQARRMRRRLTLIGTGLCILIASGVITAFLPADSNETDDLIQDGDTTQLTNSVVAPLPYQGDSGSSAETVDWGDVGPTRQTENYTYTAAPETPSAVPEFGKVDLSWFDDAAFLGDSLTVGYTEYSIDVGDALVCAYEGASPNDIVNRTTMTSDVRGEEIPLDVLAQAQPKKLYVLLGANSLAYSTTNDEGFLNYYGRMLDDLIAALPDTTIYVQSVLPVQAEAQADMPGLSPDRVSTINASLSAMAAEKGCLYLALNEALVDENGYLRSDYAQPDGLHLSGTGYSAWVDYLCTHVPYDKDNPYQVGSTCYLSDEWKELISDLS